MLINKQSTKEYLKIDQISIGSSKKERKKEEKENRNERQGRRELFSPKMQIHWNEFQRDVRLSQYSAEGKEKSITAACSLPSSRSSLFPSSFLPFFTLRIAFSLSLLTHREGIFQVNFLAAPSDIPRTGIYIFVGPLASPPSPLLFTLSTLVSLVSSFDFLLLQLPFLSRKKRCSQFPTVSYLHNMHFAIIISNIKLN